MTSLPQRAPAPRPAVRDVIALIKDSYPDLSPAEQSVADAVLSDVAGAVEASNAEIALRAGVSQPTVTRFCRSIGCDGVRDFKLQLARSLVVGDLYLASEAPVLAEGARPPFWAAVLSEARGAIRAVEQQLDPAQVARAADLVAGAGMVVTFGLGGSSTALAEELAHRLFRYGVRVTALSDPYRTRMQLATCREGDLLIAISATGRTREVIEAAELARHYRARTVAITPPGSELAGAVDVALTAGVPEYPDTLKPTASRFVNLTMIDLLAAATGYRMGAGARENLRRIKYAALARRPGAMLEPLGD
jgi:DNA-binding MurR/RpiR family transcriptional regulator